MQEVGRERRRRKSAAALCASGCLLLALIPNLPVAPAFATPSPTELPTNGSVVSGQATITSNNAVMNVNQTTNKAILNWSTFNIGAQAQVNFNQPGATSKTLNRVTGGDASQIYGKLKANGEIYLINPNGVVIGKDAQITASGVVASTLDITDQDFQNGNNKFERNSISGAVVNEGAITTPSEGYVALLGVNVTNKGTVETGKAILAAGSKVEIPVTESGLISIEADVEDAALTNEGTIKASNAQLLSGETVTLKGNSLIDTSSTTGKGGTVNVIGKAVKVQDQAHIKANGKTGGGTIAIGNKNKTSTVEIGETARLEANATGNGEGGSILLWSNASTTVAGSLFAQGGPEGGSGGFVETSSKGSVKIKDSAEVNTLAFLGKTGTWLLDPVTYIIAATGGDETGASVEASLASSNRSISADTVITVNDAINWSANTLTLTAGTDIAVNAEMSAAGTAALVMTTTSGNVIMGMEGNRFLGKINMASGTSLTINSHAYTIINSLGAQGSTTGTDLQGILGALGGYYALGSDLDASATSPWNSGAGFEPLGNSSAYFTGVFNGLGHTISNVTINRPTTDYVGIFGRLSTGAIVSNIGLLNANVTGQTFVGTLVGYNRHSIFYSFATGAVTGNGYSTGGLTGYNQGSTVGCHADVEVLGMSYDVGGLAGYNQGSITNSYATGDVDAAGSYSGGLVGRNYGTVDISYATGNVYSTTYDAGGFVGRNNGTINYSYSLGNVYSTGLRAGGFAGTNYITITGAYSSGAVSGGGGVGGLVGLNTGTVTDSFWNTTTSGQTASSGGTGLTTAQAMSESNFTGWDFASTWAINPGASYPYLQWQGTPSIITAAGNLGAAQSIQVVINGTAVKTAQTYADGSLYLVEPENTLSAGDIVLLYNIGGGASAANAVYVTGSNLASNLSLNSSTLWANSGNGALRTSDLVTAKGSLTSSDIRYTVSNGDITLLNTTTLTNTSTGGISIDNGINWSANTLTIAPSSGDININATMNATGTAALVMTTSGNIDVALDGTGFSGKINLASGTSLTINGNAYTIINSLGAETSTSGTDLQGMLGNRAGYYALGSDIDASVTSTWNYYSTGGYYYGFTPVGDSTVMFTGNFNGLGHTITNLYSYRPPTSFIGLFGITNTPAAIGNVGLINANVTGFNYVGGLIGRAYSTAVRNSYATGQMTGTHSNIGGLIGQNGGTIAGSWADGVVTGTAAIGGLVGSNNSGATITNSFASGMVGSNSPGAGGLVGTNSGLISKSYSTAKVSATSGYIGGLVGENVSTGTVEASYALGSVYGGHWTGGLVGYNEGTITGSYAAGRVTSANELGGLTSFNSGTVTDSYWNVTTSGLSSSAAGSGLTTAQLMTQSNLPGWNFASTWTMIEGSAYPYLQWQGSPKIIKASGNLSGSQLVEVVVNGVHAGSGTTAADGSVYLILPESSLSAGDDLLLYNVGGGATAANTVYVADAAQISVLPLNSSTLWADSSNGILSTSDLVTAKGSLTSTDIRYTVSGGEITLLNTTNLNNTSTGGISIDNVLTWSANTLTISPSSGDININATLNATGTAALVLTTSSDINLPLTSSGFSAKVNLATGTSLTINGNAYTIINSLGAANSTTGTDLQGINGNKSGYYALGSDIDASATATWNWNAGLGYYKGFTPLGNGTTSFSGIFDGLGHTITGLYTRQTGYYAGLFGCTNATAVLRNVGLENHTVIDTAEYVGGLVAYATGTLIDNSYMSGSVTGRFSVGGLVGQANSGTVITDSWTTGNIYANNYGSGGLVGNSAASISDSWSSADVTSTAEYVGGLAGSSSGTITNSHATGNLQGTTHVGGLVGYATGGSISNSYATGTATGTGYIGGFIGRSNATTVSYDYATGDVTTTGSTAGGFIGFADSANAVSYSFASGNATGVGNIGGFIGYNAGAANYSYATGTASGTSSIGGFVGYAAGGTISNSYAIGNAHASSINSGGLVGRNDGTISYSYATGVAVGTNYVGGLVGANNGTITNSYWNKTTSGKTTSSGSATGLTTAQMEAQSNFSGWNFSSVWSIIEGTSYPYLQWQGTPNLVKATSTLGSEKSIRVVVNGAAVGTGATAADGSLYLILPQGTFSNSDDLLLYQLGGGASSANAVFVAGSNVASGISLSASTLWADSASGSLSNTSFSTALGSLTSSDILYTASGNDLTITAPTTTLQNTSGAGIAIDGNITTSNGALTFNSATTLSANAALNTGTATTTFNSTLDGNHALTITAGTTIFGNVVGDSTPLSGLTVNGAVNLNSNLTTDGATTFNGALSLGGNEVVNAGSGALTFSSIVNNGYSLSATASSIAVNGATNWSSNTLTFTTTSGNMDVNAVLTASGTAGLVITTAGDLNMALGNEGYTGKINMASTASLTIDGNPYKILTTLGTSGSTSTNDLQGMRGNRAGYYALGTDIDASATATWNYYAAGGYYYGFSAISNSSGAQFTGSFNGLGHTISNLYIHKPTVSSQSLFGWISSTGSVRSIGLTNIDVTGSYYAAGISGISSGAIGNSFVTGAITGSSNAGGLIGYSYGTIDGTFFSGTVSGTLHVGGLVGTSEGTISDSFTSGTVTATSSEVGGLAGDNTATGSIVSSHSSSTVGSGSDAGGLIGLNNGEVQDSYATGNVSGSNATGGLVGYNSSGTITCAYATGSVTGITYAGGIAGQNNGNISESYATGSVTGTSTVGGLVGRTYGGVITNSAAYGSASGTDYVGGAIGVNNGGTITKTFSIGKVTGAGSYIGGFIGRSTSGTVANNYWNKTTSSHASSYSATGLTSADAKTASSFTGWDFSSTWAIVEGTSYPYPKWMGTPSFVLGAGNLSGGQTAHVAVNGQLSPGSGTIGADGSVYALLPEGTIANGDELLLYISNGGTDFANAVYRTTSNVTTGVVLNSGTLWVNAATGQVSNALLSAALGSLTSTDILYTASGNNLTITAGTTTLANTSGDGIAINGSLTSSGAIAVQGAATVSADITSSGLDFTGPMTLGSNIVLDSGAGPAAFASTIDGAYNFTVSSSTITLGGVLGATMPLNAVSLTSQGSLTLPSISAATIVAHATGASSDLTLSSGTTLTATASGTSIDLGAGRHFLNQSGSSALAATGRWLIFAASAEDNVYGNLNSGNTAVWHTNIGDTIAQTGNRYAFAYQPTVTFTSTDANKTYGEDITTSITSGYTISGVQSGVTGAFLSDTNASAFSGSATVTSSGAVGTASVAGSPYTMTVSEGSLVGLNGYALAYASDGRLTVTPAVLSVTANPASKTSGMAEPTLTYDVTGLKANDTAATVLSGTLTRQVGEIPGDYSIERGSLTAIANYTLSFTGNVFTIAAGAQPTATLIVQSSLNTLPNTKPDEENRLPVEESSALVLPQCSTQSTRLCVEETTP